MLSLQDSCELCHARWKVAMHILLRAGERTEVMTKVKVTLGCDMKLIARAKKRKINLSLLLEESIVFELGRLDQMSASVNSKTPP